MKSVFCIGSGRVLPGDGRPGGKLPRPSNAAIWAVMLATAVALQTSADAQQIAASAGPTTLGRSDPAKIVTVALTLPSRDPDGARDFVAHVTQPGNPLFHHYLSRQDYVARFGARQADYDAVVAWAKTRGLSVGEHYAARTVIDVTGPIGSVEAAIGVTFHDFRDASNRVYFMATGAPHLPASLIGKVTGVVGLSGAARGLPQIRPLPRGVHPQIPGTGPGGGYSAADLRSIYKIPDLPLGAQPQTLAVFETGGFAYSDVAKYAEQNKLPAVPATFRSVNGYLGGIKDPMTAAEAVLDIDMLIAMNPAAKEILVYEDGVDTFQLALLDSLSAMATDDTATSIGISYGEDEALQGADAIAAESTVLTQMAAQGQAVFASSGDRGAFGDGTASPYNVFDPASQPLVTGVGGTTLFSDAHRKYIDEETWNNIETGNGAGGGGVSSVWPLPIYQRFLERTHGPSIAKMNGGSATFRNVPDVAAVANPLTGVSVYDAFLGGWMTVGGTSVSAPLWAGFYSLANSVSEALQLGRTGFANPMLYAFPQSLALVQPAFHDVMDGTNGVVEQGRLVGFHAGFRYDNTTGNGSFIGVNTFLDLALYSAVVNRTNPPASPENLQATAKPAAATIYWSASSGATGYFVIVQDRTTGEETFGVSLNSPLTVGGLTPNTSYLYGVGAVSPGGISFLNFSSIVTPPKGH